MPVRKGIGLMMVSFFVSASALGISVYSAVNNGSEPNIVAVWEDISGSGENFYLIISNNQINNSDYCSLADGNTSIILTKSGCYRFTLKFTLGSLTSTDAYEFVALKNGVTHEGLFYIDTPEYTFLSVNIILFVLSDGDDAIKFRWYTHDYDTFAISNNPAFNQIVLEFVEEI